MVSKGKIDYMLKSGKKCFCLFNFTDGLYYWEYCENNFKVVNIKRRDRNNKGKPHLSIPITSLKKLE